MAYPGAPGKSFQWFLLMFAEENCQQTLAGTTEMAFPGAPENHLSSSCSCLLKKIVSKHKQKPLKSMLWVSFGEEASEENKNRSKRFEKPILDEFAVPFWGPENGPSFWTVA